MRSHLTRRVFRCLIANEPIFPQRHLHARAAARPHKNVFHGCQSQRRTFFNLFDNKEKDLREPTLDPGMDKMLELDKRIHLIARLPPAQDLIVAFNAFIDSRARRKRPVEDFHAIRLIQVLETLEKKAQEVTPGSTVPSLTEADLSKALATIVTYQPNLTKTHNELARLIIAAHEGLAPLADSQEKPLADRMLKLYITVLCETGATQDALDIWQKKQPDDVDSQVWARLVEGFAKEDREDMILQVVELATANATMVDPVVARAMALYYARKDNVAATKKWMESTTLTGPGKRRGGKEAASYRIILEFCLRNHEMEWGQKVLQAGGGKNAEEHIWDAIFRAAAATGKSVDEIDRMVTLMLRETQHQDKEAQLGVQTFNGLIEYALLKNDAYTAERYFSMAEKWKVQLNAQSFVLQVEYRLAAGDVNGALRSYDKLRDEKIGNDEDWAVMNKLLLAVLNQPTYANETVVGLVEDISDRRRVFPAETVLALCDYHLKRDEYLELVDLLQTYAYQYSIAERLRMRDQLVKYTLDPNTDTGRAWDTYMIFHQIFDIETQRDIRNEVITSLFERGRPDLATHVFSRMSRHVRADTRPDEETYVRMFEGIAKTADPEALEVAHNLLKLDTETDPTTRILNGLMLAYTACDSPRRALEYWDQISTSDEGPSYNSLHIALRACEKAPWGYRTAKTIWGKLLESDVVIEKDLFASYVGALSGQSLFDDLVDTVDKMQEMVGEEPDVLM